MASSNPKAYSTDPTLWLYTSLSSGSSHIVTATSRLQLILTANKVPFQALDVATDEKARMLWGRRAGKRKLPGLVRMGMVLADLDEVEEWNEYGEIKENLLDTAAPAPVAKTPATSSTSNTPSKPTTAAVTPAPPVEMAPGPDAPPLPASIPAPKSIEPSSKTPVPEAPAKIPEPLSETTTKSPPATAEPQKTLATAMRDIHFEVAQKAKAAKLKSVKAMAAGTSTKKEDAADVEENIAKLDNSTTVGVPPPTDDALAKDSVATGAGAPEGGSNGEDVPDTKIESQEEPSTEEGKAGEPLTAQPGPETEKETNEGTKEAADSSLATPAREVGSEESGLDAQGPESLLVTSVPKSTGVYQQNLQHPRLESAAVSDTSLLGTTAGDITHHRTSSIGSSSKEEIEKAKEESKVPGDDENVNASEPTEDKEKENEEEETEVEQEIEKVKEQPKGPRDDAKPNAPKPAEDEGNENEEEETETEQEIEKVKEQPKVPGNDGSVEAIKPTECEDKEDENEETKSEQEPVTAPSSTLAAKADTEEHSKGDDDDDGDDETEDHHIKTSGEPKKEEAARPKYIEQPSPAVPGAEDEGEAATSLKDPNTAPVATSENADQSTIPIRSKEEDEASVPGATPLSSTANSTMAAESAPESPAAKKASGGNTTKPGDDDYDPYNYDSNNTAPPVTEPTEEIPPPREATPPAAPLPDPEPTAPAYDDDEYDPFNYTAPKTGAKEVQATQTQRAADPKGAGESVMD